MNLKNEKAKVLVIGLDGATFDNLKPWIKEGKLPNFAYIMENGVHGPLKSTIPHLTAPAWTSLFTGKNPGKHGIFDFFTPQSDYSIQIIDSTSRKSKPFKFNRFMITSLGTPRFEEKSKYPKSLWREISKMFIIPYRL